MPLIIAGNIARDEWEYLDLSEQPLTGMTAPANVTLILRRDVGAGFVDVTSTVPVSWTEGDTGHYDVSFVATLAGFYRLYLKELHPSSFQRRWTFPFEVLSAGSAFTPSFANAFCAETDVESWAQLDFYSGSKPSSVQVAGFAQGRASEMRALLAADGWTISPPLVTPGSAEEDMLRACNAVGAAADAWRSKFRDTDPANSEHGSQLGEEYQARLSRLQEYAKKVAGTSQLLRSPMTSGEVTLADETPITDMGLRDAITMDQEF